MFRWLEHTINEDSLKKLEGFSAERSFKGDLISAFKHLKRITEKNGSNFS